MARVQNLLHFGGLVISSIGVNMCKVWKLLGAIAFVASLLYKLGLIAMILLMWNECSTDCSSKTSSKETKLKTYTPKYIILNYFDKVDVYCEEPPGLFFLYVPIPFFALLIILCDFRVSMKYLET